MAEQLPVEIWVLILRHVPQTDRLSSCALVSQKLHAAAAAATDALELAFTQGQEQWQQRAEAFETFLQQHGSHLTSLKLSRTEEQTLSQLPCSRLLCLELTRGVVQLGPHNGLPGVLASCTGLTRLTLSTFRVPMGLSGISGLSGLSVLVNLRDLQLVMTSLANWGVFLGPLPGSVLSCMLHLTRLHLSSVNVADVHHVSCLSSLAVLSLCCEGSVKFAPDIAPGLVLPASLRDLTLRGPWQGSRVKLGPSVLSAAVQLTRLELRAVVVMGQAGMSDGAALLAAVSGLRNLGTLKLEDMALVWPRPSAAYQAVTASSRLQSLMVFDCELPAGVWEHVFPAARICGQLQQLQIIDDVSAGDVSALVRCCPCLQHLYLTVRSGPPVAALRPLTCLTSLTLEAVGYSRADVADCVQAVAALTSLRSLCLYESTLGLGGAAVLPPLTALTQLTSCALYDLWRENKAAPGQPPDVWQQLRQHCLEEWPYTTRTTDTSDSDG